MIHEKIIYLKVLNKKNTLVEKKSLLKKKVVEKKNIHTIRRIEYWKFELEKLNQLTPLYTIRRGGEGGAGRR